MTTDTTTELRTRIASLEAELVAARPQWQPIETAPSDVEVLMYSPWAHATNPERIDLGIYHDTRGGSRHPWATHWMPLPTLPDRAALGATDGAQR